MIKYIKQVTELDELLAPNINADYISIVDSLTGTLKKTLAKNVGSTAVNVTTQGNTFNGASQLVQLDSIGRLPAISGNLLVSLNASNFTGGTLADARLSANVTTQGNTFNIADKLVKLDVSNRFPASNGSLITDLNASAITSGLIPDAQLSTNVSFKTKTLFPVTLASVYPLADVNRDSMFVVGHASGTANFSLQGGLVSTGASFTIITNTIQAISFTCDPSSSAYFINQAGSSVTIAPSGTYSPTNQRGRVITVTCVNLNTFVLSGSGL